MSFIAILSLSAMYSWSPLPLTPSVPGSNERVAASASQNDDAEKEIQAAGDDIERLLKLAASYKKASKNENAKRVYQRIIELDTNHEEARKALRHERYAGRWFESYVALSRFKREEMKRMKAKGLVPFEDRFVPEQDLPFYRMGWVQNEANVWVHPQDLEHAKQVAEWQAAGYQFRADDNSWIAPEDFEKWAALLWKCGDEWLPTERADEYHSDLAHPWELTGEHFQIMTTCPWNYANAARWHADQTHEHLVRLFGKGPATQPEVFLLSSLDEYNFAGGVMVDAGGLASLHGAYFADGAVDTKPSPAKFDGIGVCYWAVSDPNVSPWGPYWVRWAAAQSFVEAIDPSWDAVGLYMTIHADPNRSLQEHGARFWAEKRIPRWLRYGAASYVERFLPNPESQSEADLWSLRSFAFEDLKKQGGLRKLDELFAFAPTLTDSQSSARLYNEAGLLVSYLLDGAPGDAELQEALKAVQVSLASGDAQTSAAAARALESNLKKREAAIRAYAGL